MLKWKYFVRKFFYIGDQRIWGGLVSMATGYTPHYTQCNM